METQVGPMILVWLSIPVWLTFLVFRQNAELRVKFKVWLYRTIRRPIPLKRIDQRVEDFVNEELDLTDEQWND